MSFDCCLCTISGRDRSYKTQNELDEHLGQYHGFETVELLESETGKTI